MQIGSILAVFLHSAFGTVSISNSAMLNAMQGAIKRFLNSSLIRYTDEPTNQTVTWLWSLTNSIYFLGFLLGTLIMRPMAERRGRKFCSFIINDCGIMFGSCLIMASKWFNLFELLLLGRLVLGVSRPCGIFVRIYTHECCGLQWAALGTSIIQLGCIAWLAITSAITMPQVLGNDSTWQFVLLPQIFAAFIHLLVGYSLLPESPKHLYITENNYQKAVDAISFYQGSNCDVESEIDQLEREAQLIREVPEPTLKQVLSTSYYSWPFWLTITCGLVSCSGGLLFVDAYSTSILVLLGLDERKAASLSFFLIMLPALGCCPFGIMATRKIARRKHLFFGLSVMCFGSFLIICSLCISKFHTVAQCLGILGMVSITVSCWVSTDIVTQVIPGEICPQNIRSLSVSARLFISYIMSTLELLFILPLIQYVGGLGFSPILLLGLLCFVFLYKYLPETFEVPLDVTVEKWKEVNEGDALIDDNTEYKLF